jgi:hypothetical protein
MLQELNDPRGLPQRDGVVRERFQDLGVGGLGLVELAELEEGAAMTVARLDVVR